MTEPRRRRTQLVTIAFVALTSLVACKRSSRGAAAPLDAREATVARTPSESAHVVAHGTIRASSLVRANGAMYWLEDRPDGAVVVHAPLGGGPSVTLATGAHPSALAVDARMAYVGGDDGVLAVPLDGAPPVRLAEGVGRFVGLAIDERDVYFAEGFGGSIGCGCCGCWKSPRRTGLLSVPKSAATARSKTPAAPTALYNDWYLTALGLDDDAAYVVRRGELLRVPKAGGRPESLASNVDGPLAIAPDSIYGVAAGGQLVRVPKSGGPPVALAAPLGTIVALTLSDDAVFVGTLARTIVRVPARGPTGATSGGGRVLYREPTGLGAPRALALDGDGVWASWVADVVDARTRPTETWILRVGR